MTGWGDYAITKVKFKEDDVHILAVEVREYKDTKLLTPTRWERSQVVQAISSGKKFTTATYNTSKKYWEIGEPVHIFPIKGEEFIRTNPDQEKRDNLGSLPAF